MRDDENPHPRGLDEAPRPETEATREAVGAAAAVATDSVGEFAGTIEPWPVVGEETPAPPPALPVDQAERVKSVDVLRGVALLGILAMNIVSFGWPSQVYGNPFRGAGFTGLNKALWYTNHLVFEMKMMTLFSMLFGAGLVLMSDRAAAKGRSLRGVYYRRVLWLLAIGMVHAYFIWSGDILVLYAQCGLILYPLRNLSARTLMALGVAALMVIVPVLGALNAGLYVLETTAQRVEAKVKAGETPTNLEKKLKGIWDNVGKEMKPDEAKAREKFEKELRIYRGSYWGQVKDRAKELWAEHTIGFVLGGFWLAAGRMLLGMGLMKAGVFSASRSMRFYWTLMLIGYGIGIPLMIYDAEALIRNRFSSAHFLGGGIFPNYFGSILMALGHTGLVMLICKSGALPWLTRRLAAAGRMALSNYLFDSIFCTFLFYGWGAGFFGRLDRAGMFAVVLWIWAFQLVLSPIWLNSFKYGPAEWLWRSLTYGKPQPMRQQRAVEMEMMPAAA